MPNITVAASMIGQFLKGVQARQASDDQKASAQKADRMQRAGNFFSMSNDLKQRSEDESLTLQERDRLRSESENLYAGGLDLWGQIDAKPKAGGKKNAVMQILQFLNPLAKRGDTGDSEFEDTFSRVISGLGGRGEAGAAGGAEAPGMTDAGIAAAMENPAAAGFAAGGAVPGDRGMSTPEGEVGPFAAAGAGAAVPPGAVPPGAVPGAVPGATPPGEPPYVSKYFRDPKAERAAQYQQVSTIFQNLRQSFQAKGIDSIQKLQADPQGMQIINNLQFLAGEHGFDAFDELDEIYAGLGLTEARTAKDQFEEGYFALAQKQARGETLTEGEQQNLTEYRRLRRAGSGTPETPNQALWTSILAKHGGDVTAAHAEWTKTTAKTGTQGFRLTAATNPATGRSELLKVNNRTGDTSFTGIEVPSDFSIDSIMTKDFEGVEHMDAAKIRFHFERGSLKYETIQWLLQDMPDTAIDPLTGREGPNPQKEKLQRFFNTLPKPTEASEAADAAQIRAFALSKNMSFEEARTELERLGLKVREGG